MKQKLFLFLISIGISLSFSSNANAIIGLTLKKNTIRSLGIIATGGGSGIFATSAIIAINSRPYTTVLSAALSGAVLGSVISTLGLIILDDNSASIEFNEINSSNRDFYLYSSKQIEIYNSELEELNAIKNSLDLEIDQANLGDQEVIELWNSYKDYLSEETIHIAQDISKRFLKKLTSSSS